MKTQKRMEVTEIKHKKEDLQEKISSMLKQFQFETGVTIDEIRPHFAKPIGSPDNGRFENIYIKIRI